MAKFKKITREEKIQNLVETHDVYCDIQITLKWLYSWERWIGGQCLKIKHGYERIQNWFDEFFKKWFVFSLKLKWHGFHWLHEGEKISFMLWQWKKTYDHLVRGISKYVDGVPK